jgi:surface antigen
MPDTPNVVATSIAAVATGTKRLTFSTVGVLYDTCRTITTATNTTQQSIKSGTASTVRGVGSGIAFVGNGIAHSILFGVRTVGSSIMFVVHMPGKVASGVTQMSPVSFIRPADAADVPIISAETSAAALEKFNTLQREQITQWQAAQAAANRTLGGSLIAGDPNHGGYPAKWDTVRQDSTLDSWGMYNRECVSYAAWKVYQTYGAMPYWGGVGNANQWIGNARRAGIPTSSTPRVHSVAISMRGYYGHAMWVEKVQGDMVYVSQYNYDLHGHYSEMWVHSSYFTYIYFN